MLKINFCDDSTERTQQDTNLLHEISKLIAFEWRHVDVSKYRIYDFGKWAIENSVFFIRVEMKKQWHVPWQNVFVCSMKMRSLF